jgi:hypothetical protein
MGLAAVGAHKLGGVLSVGAIFKASVKIGQRYRGTFGGKYQTKYQTNDPLQILQVKEASCGSLEQRTK